MLADVKPRFLNSRRSISGAFARSACQTNAASRREADDQARRSRDVPPKPPLLPASDRP